MNYNHTHCSARDLQNYKIANTIKDNTNKKAKILRRFKDNFVSDQNYCYDLGTSSSTLTDLQTNLTSKQRNIHSSGSVDKRPLVRSHARSSTCLEYAVEENNILLIQKPFDPTILNKGRFLNTEDDIDYIPVKLASSDANFSSNCDKMKGARHNTNLLTKSVEKKVNSWGRILKDQNVVKDPKKTIGILQTSKNKPKPAKTQPQVKEKHVAYEQNLNIPTTPPSNRNKLSTPNSMSSTSSVKVGSKKRANSKSRNRIVENEPAYSDSATTITGESIMLVDRSAQCSSTNMEIDHKWHRNIDINQAGDNGLAYFNPVRTLNFLVRELRGKLSEESEDENMARIIHDMENTIARLSSSSSSSQHMIDNNWNTLISEDDLKYVLELLQSPPIPKPVVEDKGATSELQSKLEETCVKLEAMCLQMEQVTCTKLREEKEAICKNQFQQLTMPSSVMKPDLQYFLEYCIQSSASFCQLNERNKEYEALTNKIAQHEHFIKDLKKKTDEQAKIIMALKETNNRASALNKILNEQLEDTEKKYQELVTEMQFLMLEKEKNIVLMKCKDQDLIEMRKNLEEIKALVIEHLTSINLQSSDSSSKLPKENKLDFDNLTTVSALSLTILQNRRIENESPKCLSETSPMSGGDEPSVKIVMPTVIEPMSQVPEQVPSKTAGIKVSIKNILDEMKQTKLTNNLSVQNLMNLDDPTGITNWSDLDISDDELHSGGGFHISDTDTNF